jgi:hypothetical protein
VPWPRQPEALGHGGADGRVSEPRHPDHPDSLDMVWEVLLGMGDCERDGLVGNMLGEIIRLLGQVENLGGELRIAGYCLAPND